LQAITGLLVTTTVLIYRLLRIISLKLTKLLSFWTSLASLEHSRYSIGRKNYEDEMDKTIWNYEEKNIWALVGHVKALHPWPLTALADWWKVWSMRLTHFTQRPKNSQEDKGKLWYLIGVWDGIGNLM
jgi:hypothetical protein